MAHTPTRNSNRGSRVRFNPNTGRPLGRGESTTFQGRTYREGSSNIGGTGGSSGGSNTQDPNTPRYTRETGLLTDYGRSLGLSEVSRSTRESGTINSTDTTPEKPIVISPKPIGQDYSSLVAGLSQTTPEEVAPSTDTQEPTNFAQIREMIGFSPQKGNVGDDREFRRAQRDVERARETSRGYTDSINAIVAKSQADQLSVTGQGRGIPEAIIGGQQAQISREAAIQALPIAAQQAAAQGNLEQAQAHLENVYRIKSESLQNEYEYQTKKYDSIMGYITKLEEAQIARLKATDTNKFNEDEDFQKLQDSLAKDNPAMATRIWGAKDRAELGKVVGGIGGGPDSVKPMNDTQAVTYGYAKRLTESNQIVSKLGGMFTGIGSYFGQNVPNPLKSVERQQFEQAQRNFINAVLRRESGAVISKEEFENARQQYFPQPGDKQETINQKSRNRDTVIANFYRQAGTLGQTQQQITRPEDLRTKYNY